MSYRGVAGRVSLLKDGVSCDWPDETGLVVVEIVESTGSRGRPIRSAVACMCRDFARQMSRPCCPGACDPTLLKRRCVNC